MPTEPTDLKDEPVTEEPVAPVPTEPTDLKDEPVTEEPGASVTQKPTDPRPRSMSLLCPLIQPT